MSKLSLILYNKQEPMEHIKDFLKNARTEYDLANFDIKTADPDPFVQFAVWMKMAVDYNVNEPNAMNLATVSESGQPSSRIVLLRDFTTEGFSFFTNYNSHKGKELEHQKLAALNFFWPELHKQIRIEGVASRLNEHDSDEYFQSRPRESQIGALISQQSTPLNSREELEQKAENLTRELEGKEVQRPKNWGGYKVSPTLFEFWQGRPSRLHDRIRYDLTGGSWKLSRLYP